MYYNIECYNGDMEKLFGDYTGYKLGQGWPAYKNMSVEEMADIIDDTTFVPKYDTENGNSAVVSPNNNVEISKRDIELMKNLYSDFNKLLNSFVEEVIDEYEYMESPIYDAEGIDRETLAQIVDRVIALAESRIDEAEEINLEAQQSNLWSRRDMFRNLIQAIVLVEIFAVRRPNFRRVRNGYVFREGRYDGVRES